MVDIKNLRPCKAGELFPGAVFYLQMENGNLERCTIETEWYKTEWELKLYREQTKKYSIEGRLFTRRDKPFHDFRDIEFIAEATISFGNQVVLKAAKT